MASSNQESALDDGFTIPELLVSLALLSLITVLSIQGLRTVGLMDRVSNTSDQYAVNKAVERHLKVAISSTRAVFSYPKGKKATLAFEADKHRLAFVMDGQSSVEIGGLYAVQIFMHEQKLVTTRTIFRPQESIRNFNLKNHLLMTNIQQVSYKYFGRINEAAEAAWHDHWTNPSQLPGLVLVTVTRQLDKKKFKLSWRIHLASSKR